MFFLELGCFALLYYIVVDFLILLFQIIERAFPDILQNNYYDFWSGSIRWAIASLIIAYPVMVLLNWLLRCDWRLTPENRQNAFRRWLSYLTIFLTGGALLGDLVSVLYYFLGGEITSRFIFKVLAVALTSGLVFSYFLYELRRQDTDKDKSRRFVWLGAIFILASIIAGFFITGSPFTARQIKFDGGRVNNLQDLQSRVINHWQNNGTLPASLLALDDQLQSYGLPKDPETSASYEYKILGANKFELCANFNREGNLKSGYGGPMIVGALESNWSHGAGRVCFTRTIDPKPYPIRPVSIPIINP